MIGLICFFIYLISHLAIQQILPKTTDEFIVLSRLRVLGFFCFILMVVTLFLFNGDYKDLFIFIMMSILYIFLCLLSLRSIRLRQLTDYYYEKKDTIDEKTMLEKRLDFLISTKQISKDLNFYQLDKRQVYYLDRIFLIWSKILKNE